MTKITANFENQTIYVGLDVHKRSWNAGIFLGDMFVKNIHQQTSPEVLYNYLTKQFPGASYQCAYESGKFGYWIQRQLSSLGITCLVVNPADIPSSHKDEVYKTDIRDRGVLARHWQKGSYAVFTSLHFTRKPTETWSGNGRKSGGIWCVVKTG